MGLSKLKQEKDLSDPTFTQSNEVIAILRYKLPDKQMQRTLFDDSSFELLKHKEPFISLHNEAILFLSEVPLVSLLDSSASSDSFLLVNRIKIIYSSFMSGQQALQDFQHLNTFLETNSQACFGKPDSTIIFCPPIQSIVAKDSLYKQLIEKGFYKFIYLSPSEISTCGNIQQVTQEKFRNLLEDIDPFVIENHNEGNQESTPDLFRVAPSQFKTLKLRIRNIVQKYSNRIRESRESSITDCKKFNEAIQIVNNEQTTGLNVISNIQIQILDVISNEMKDQNQSNYVCETSDDPYTKRMQTLLNQLIIDNIKNRPSEINKIFPLKSITHFEQSLIEVIQRLFKQKVQRNIKMAIVTQNNNRATQIANQLDQLQTMGNSFKVFKSQIQKKTSSNTGRSMWEKHLKDYDIFCFLPKTFHEHLMHSDFKINEFHVIFFDEIHSTTFPDHPFNQIMCDHYFNNPIKEELQRFPLIFGMGLFDNLFKAAANQTLQIETTMTTFSNMLNASLFNLNIEEAIHILRIYFNKFITSNRRTVSKLFQMYIESIDLIQFINKMANTMVVGEQSWSNGVIFKPNKQLSSLKKEDPGLVLSIQKSSAKITIFDSKKQFNHFISIVNTQLTQYKEQIKINDIKIEVKVETAQYVDPITKIRYFSARAHIDPNLMKMLEIELNPGTEFLYSLSSLKQESLMKINQLQQIPYKNDKLIFKKKLEAENYIYLQLYKRLHQLNLLDDYLYPNEQKIKETIIRVYQIEEIVSQGSSKEINRQFQMGYSEEYKELNKSISQKEEFSEKQQSLSSKFDSQQQKSIVSMSIDSQTQLMNFKRDLDLNHIKSEKILQDQQNDLQTGLMEYNINQLIFFIEQIFNPIISAISEYETEAAKVANVAKEFKKKEKKDKDYDLAAEQFNKCKYNLRWMNFDRNINLDQVENLFDQQNSSILNKEVSNALDFLNPLMNGVRYESIYALKIREYNEQLFNLEGAKTLQDSPQFTKLVDSLNNWLDNFTLPAYMVAHYDYDQHDPKRLKDQDNNKRKKILILSIMIIALTDSDSSIKEYKIIKDEMERLAFVGDSFINTAVIMNLYFRSQGGLNEKDYDSIKIPTIKSSNIEKLIKEFNLQQLLLKSKFINKFGQLDKNDTRERKLTAVLQSLVGFFGIYIGFSSAYLFLHDIGLVKSNKVRAPGQNQTSNKIEVLKELSEQYNKIIMLEKEVKTKLFEYIKSKYYDLDVERNLLKDQKRFEEKQQAIHLFIKHSTQRRNKYDYRAFAASENRKPCPFLYQMSENPISLSTLNRQQDHFQSDEFYQDEDYSFIEQTENWDNGDIQDIPSVDYDEEGEKILDNIIKVTFEKENIENGKFYNFSPEENKSGQCYASEDQTKDGYFHNIPSIALQCYTHKSFSEKLAQRKMDGLNLSNQQYDLIRKQKIEASKMQILAKANPDNIDDASLLNQLILQLNFQIYEYLGDSILNQTIAKQYYLGSALDISQKFQHRFSAQKLHDSKTWFTSNHWLASTMCERYFQFCQQLKDEFPNHLRKQVEQTMKNIDYKFDQSNSIQNDEFLKDFRNFPQIPFLVDGTNTKYTDQLERYQGTVTTQCYRKFKKSQERKNSAAAQKNSAESSINLINQKMQWTLGSNQSVSTKASSQMQMLSLTTGGQEIDKDSFEEDEGLKKKDSQYKGEEKIQEKNDVEDEENFFDQQDAFVKIFSDSLEALFGGFFIDSGDFEETQLYIIEAMESHYFKDTIRQDQERTKVLNVWNSKKYTHSIKISHTVEENHQGFFYVRIFFGKTETRRCKFDKDKKRKVEKAYLDTRFYLEEAYDKFESEWLDKMTDKMPTHEDWNNFNNIFRKNYRPNKAEQLKKREKSLFKETCRKLDDSIDDHYSDQRQALQLVNQDNHEFYIDFSQRSTDFRSESSLTQEKLIYLLVRAFNEASLALKIKKDRIVHQLECERVSSSFIRDLMNQSDIRYIQTLNKNCKSIEGWVNQLTKNQLDQLLIQMVAIKQQIKSGQTGVDNNSIDNQSRMSRSTIMLSEISKN